MCVGVEDRQKMTKLLLSLLFFVALNQCVIVNAASWDTTQGCWQVQWSDVTILAQGNRSQPVLIVSTMFCTPFNDLGAALGDTLPGSQLGSGWTILVDPCNRTGVDPCGIMHTWTGCLAMFVSTMANLRTEDGTCPNSLPTAAYTYVPRVSQFSQITLKSMAPLTEGISVLIQPDLPTIEASTSIEAGLSACTPLWFSGINVIIQNFTVNLTQCIVLPYLAATDTMCVRFTGTDVSSSVVTDVKCIGSNFGIVVQSQTAGLIDASGSHFHALPMTAGCLYGDLVLWNVATPRRPIHLSSDLLWVITPFIVDSDIIYVNGHRPRHPIVNSSVAQWITATSPEITPSDPTVAKIAAYSLLALLLVITVLVIGKSIITCIKNACEKPDPEDYDVDDDVLEEIKKIK